MSYNISSSHFPNPFYKEVLDVLVPFFKQSETEFYIIGATARDIILSGVYNESIIRSTNDLDIAIAIPDWSKFQEISTGICAMNGFEKSREQAQRFVYKAMLLLDIVPFGEVAGEEQSIFWPPDHSTKMSVAGFSEILKNTLDITIDKAITIRVASLAGVFILKLNAWDDRHLLGNKDADDIATILSSYYDINEQRVATDHFDLYDIVHNFRFVAGATLLGRDIKQLLKDDQATVDSLHKILQAEIQKYEDSHLINQMLESHKFLKYEEVLAALQSIAAEILL